MPRQAMSQGLSPQRDFMTRLNETFATIAGWSYDHNFFVLGICGLLAAGGIFLASKAQTDGSYAAFFDEGDPSYLAYEQYREDFGSDEISYILYEAPAFPHGAWNLEVMRKIEDLTRALEDEVPFVYEVTSVVNAELVEGVPGGIEISELDDDFPESQEALLALRERYLAKPLLVGGLVAEDRKHAAIIIEMDRSSTDPMEEIRLDPQAGDALENLYPQVTDSAIAEILARPEYADIVFHHSGDVPVNAIFNRVLGGETVTLGLITAVLVGGVLFLSFRSVVATLAPLVVVQLCVILSIALLSLLGWKLTINVMSLPTLVTAIGVAHSVHILSAFRQRFAVLRDRRQALVETFYLVGTPCLLTSLTTAAGFGALSIAPIKSIAQSGPINAFGVLAAFGMSLTLLMALLSFGRQTPDESSQQPSKRSDRAGQRARAFLVAVAAFDVRHRGAILWAFALLFLVSALGISRIVVDSNWLDDFWDSDPVKQQTMRVDEVMGGTTNLVYLFDAGVEGGIKEPAVLREMERVQNLLQSHGSTVRKTYSLVDILKDLNQSFHDGDPSWYEIPESRELVAQYLLLYESSGGEDAEKYVSLDYRHASVEARIAMGTISNMENLAKRVDADLAREPLEHSRTQMTGMGALWVILMDFIVSSQIQGFLLAFGVIALMMIGIFRSLATGLISMIPNLTPVALALAFMGFFSIPLNYSKVSIAAVAIGIAVDDTVHLMSRFRHEFQTHGNYARALEAALQDVGRALLITSAALILGFLVFLLSALQSQAMYGVLLASTIVSALVADFLLMPALVLTFKPFGPEGKDVGDEHLTADA